jgi:hypothetical protein
MRYEIYGFHCVTFVRYLPQSSVMSAISRNITSKKGDDTVIPFDLSQLAIHVI